MNRWAPALVAMLFLGASSRGRADVQRELRCGERSCPTSVGWLVRETAGDEISCTAFLVAPDVIATARHCVATTRRDGSSDAPSRFSITFAATEGFGAETRDAAVLRLSDDHAVSFQSASDWALLRLSSVSVRPPIAVARAGIADGTAVRVPSVRREDRSHATIVEDACATAQHSLFAPHVDDDRAPIQVLAGCAFDLGSSGAPVLDAGGRALAIVHASDRRTWPWREPVRFPVELAGARQTEPLPIAYATNFACVELDGSAAMPASCETAAWIDRSRRPGEAASRYANQLLASLASRIEVAERDARDAIVDRDPREGWRVHVERDGHEARVVTSAICASSITAPLPSTMTLEVLVAPNGSPTLSATTRPLPPPPPCDATVRTSRASPLLTPTNARLGR